MHARGPKKPPVRSGRSSTSPKAKPRRRGHEAASSDSHEDESHRHTDDMKFRKRLAPKLLMGNDPNLEYFCVRFHQDGHLIAAARADGAVSIFNTGSGEVCWELRPKDGLGDQMPVTSVRWRPESRYSNVKNVLLVAGADGTARHWHVTTVKCLNTIRENDNEIFCVDYRPDAERFVTAGKDFHVRVYDESTNMLEAELAGGIGDVTAGHASRVFSLKYNPSDPNIIISGGWDNTIQIWDTRIGHAVRSIFGPHICGDAVDISGNIVLSGSWRDYASGSLISTIDWKGPRNSPDCLIYAAQFGKAPNCQWFCAGGSGSNEAKIFHRTSGTVLGEMYGFRKAVFSLDSTLDGRLLAIGGGGFCQLYELHLEDSIKAV